MKLMTKELENKFRKYPLYSQESKGRDAKVIAKFFNPCGAGTWWITEANQTDDGDWEMFGAADLGYGAEMGYVMLSELQSLRLPFGLTVERDRYLSDDATINSEVKRWM